MNALREYHDEHDRAWAEFRACVEKAFEPWLEGEAEIDAADAWETIGNAVHEFGWRLSRARRALLQATAA
jgi:hypothetical protein